MAVEYLRVTETFQVPTSIKFPGEKKINMSEQINTFLDSYGTDGWDGFYYSEQIRNDDYVVIIVVFKKTV